MQKVIIIRYSEIHLKGNNRGFFEGFLQKNLIESLAPFGVMLERIGARYVVRVENDTDEIAEAIRCTFGVHSLSIAFEVRTDIEEIIYAAQAVCKTEGSFKVETNRADKTFEMKSTEISAYVGGRLLEKNPGITVDVKNPESVVCIDVREQGVTFVYSEVIKAIGGMPVGTSGKGVALLSGGIDSPAACYLMAKRGMSIHALHFHSFPYTGRHAMEKVISLAKILKKYAPNIKLEMISVAEIQLEINKKCPEEMGIILLRRFMMRIANAVAKRIDAGAIITGEALGQVASQTLESINATDRCIAMPAFRPLIGFDKDEIVVLAKSIGTFLTSIRPFEDCCTLFLPKNPVTKPRIKFLERAEEALDIDILVQNALKTSEIITL